MFTGGGTNFQAAFEKVKEVLQQYTYSDEQSGDNSISNVTISFLTDGQSGQRPDMLVNMFQTTLEECWPEGPISVHSIGFGGGCDKVLLEGLRICGSVEGTFRYAEPSDDADTLSHKLTSLFDVASKGSVVPMHLESSRLGFKMGRSFENGLDVQFPVQLSKHGEYTHWVMMNDEASASAPITVTINTPLDDNTVVSVERVSYGEKVETGGKKKFFANRNDVRKKNFEKWTSQLIDDLASELLDLSKNAPSNTAVGHTSPSKNVFELHCALLMQKIEAIGVCVAGVPDLLERVTFIRQQLKDLRSGAGVNIGKLSDCRFASQFSGQAKKKASPLSNANFSALPTNSNIQPISHKKAWAERTPFYSRNSDGKGRNALQSSIMDNLYDHISDETDRLLTRAEGNHTLMTETDCKGNTALHFAAYCGQSDTVKRMLDTFYKPGYPLHDQLGALNDDNETAVTLAIKKRGFHRTLGHLLDAGATIPSDRKKGLERYAIDYEYPITANIISNLSESATTVDESMTKEYIMFAYNRLKTNGQLDDLDVPAYFQTCLSKLMVDMVKTLISDHGAVPTFKLLSDYCIPRKADDPQTDIYIQLTDLFLEYNQRTHSNDSENFILMSDENDESALFKAAERGSLPHVKYFLDKGALVDQLTNLGNTPLWIACAKRYPCIIDELLDRGADVNVTNLKGNPPMYSICQRGPLKIAETLLARGAHLEHINGNGDTLVLLCCRNGQHELLELFLNYVDPEFVDIRAHIDGFNAIFASVEANRPECIRVLHEYGVNLEQKTADDNEILAGATPLHLASYYGRTEAARMLLDCGANPNSLDNNGQTPLHIAVIQGNTSIITLLRNAKADISVKDASGNTCASYCRNRTEIREVRKNLRFLTSYQKINNFRYVKISDF